MHSGKLQAGCGLAQRIMRTIVRGAGRVGHRRGNRFRGPLRRLRRWGAQRKRTRYQPGGGKQYQAFARPLPCAEPFGPTLRVFRNHSRRFNHLTISRGGLQRVGP